MALNGSAARVAGLLGVAALIAFLLPASPGAAAPVAHNQALYEACGRVFPDPHAYWPSPAQAPNRSPWAKGNAECESVDFLGWDETLAGLDFLASDTMFGDFVEVYNLSGQDDGLASTVDTAFQDVLHEEGGEGMTAGLPTEDLEREKVPMYLVRVTDEEIDAARGNNIPIKDRQHFAYALSIHGIERAGIEGGIRAIEDLATWGSCEKHGDENTMANCEQEQAGPDNPHPILETMPDDSTTAGTALKKQSVWFMLNNPDGWRRGDKQEGGFFYQRYNGNGMDMNRDWPTKGYTFRPYTPWSEPETRAVGKALKSVKSNWTGGIDLHGQLIDRAFSFTLIGGAERPFDKDRRVLQFTKGAWEDASERLSWNKTLIKDNEAPEDDPRMYGVQWGTIWDTIDYTVTGALGDWMDSPLGLNADGIDNEMSLSHLSNCGVGTCYIVDAEQLHVDGNKSLIYAQMHFSLVPEDTTFDYKGKAAYLHNPKRLQHEGSDLSTASEAYDAPPQEDFSTTIHHVEGTSTHEFEVKGPADGVYNGGITATFTFSNVDAVSAGSLNELAVDMYRSPEEDPDRGEQTDDDWQTVNSYFNQSFVYAQGGAQIDVNVPEPGLYRLRVTGDAPGEFAVDVDFKSEVAWPDPGQKPYNVSNMDFFDMLQQFVPSDDKLVPVSVDAVLSGAVDLEKFDTVVAADDAFLPGYIEPVAMDNAQPKIEDTFSCACAPGAGERTAATSGYYEFTIEPGNAGLNAKVTSETVIDPDLYLQRKLADGSWSSDVSSGETGRSNLETLAYSKPRPGDYRLEVHNWAGGPGPVNVDITFTEVPTPKGNGPGKYDKRDRNRMAKITTSFVRGGGNLVLTDDSLRALEWLGVVGPQKVFEQTVYAGYIEFSADKGESSTYDDPLAANVNQPGAAEGENHRHQVTEPVPIGFAIQDESGGDFNSMPEWGVDQAAWKDAGGRVVGVVGADDVALGELKMGKGRIRIAGSMLPFPTDEYDHPYGLESYGVTYSGYEVFRNLLDWDRDAGATNPDPDPDPDRDPDGDTGPTDDDRDDGTAPADDDRPVLPATGGGIALALVALGTGLLMRRRLRR